jgi:glutathione S-transferase
MAITLYELAQADGMRYSPYCWRVRWSLRHKGLDFRSVAIGFDDLQKLPGGSRSVPTVEIDGHVVNESWRIAEALDETFPDRPRLFACEQAKGATRFVESFFDKVVNASLLPLFAREIHDRMAVRDQAYFRRTREQMLKRTLEEAQARRDEDVLRFRTAIHPIRLTLKAQPWLSGETPGYADYIGLASFQWARLSSDFKILADDDSVADWVNRGLDLFEGFGRNVGARPQIDATFLPETASSG